jgi:hypothetical protein
MSRAQEDTQLLNRQGFGVGVTTSNNIDFEITNRV